MGKKLLNEQQVKSLRKIVINKPLHELLLNLSVDLMLRLSDLLRLRVSNVISPNGKIKTEVRVKQKKTGKTTLNIPLSMNSIDVIKKHLVDKEQDDFIENESKKERPYPKKFDIAVPANMSCGKTSKK